MPKEFINCEDYGREVPLATAQGEEVRFGTMPTLAACIVWNKDVGDLAVRIVDRDKDPDGFENKVGDLHLDRTGVNRMIRLLRKARDDAFGKDE